MSTYSDLILGHADLVSYWRLNEASGDAIDIEGVNDGTVTGATQSASGIRQNGGDTAYSFDGVNDGIVVADHATLDTAHITVEFWAWISSLVDDDWIVRHGAGGNVFNFSSSTTFLRWHVWVGGSWRFCDIPGSAIILTAWNHIVGTYDGTTVRVYCNGVEQATAAHSGSIAASSQAIHMGQAGDSSRFWAGKMDEVALYSEALDAATILDHYEAIMPGPYTVAATARLGTATALQASTGKVWEVGSNLYTVAAETGDDDVHVYKSTDSGITWAQQDAADAPAAIAGPFDSYMRPGGSTLYVMRSSTTTTLTVRTFDCSTDQWAAADVAGTAPNAVSLIKTARMVVRSDGDVILAYTSSADDADIHYARNEAGTWTSGVVVAAVSSAAASVVVDMQIDSADMAFIYYLEVTALDLIYRSLSSANVLGTAVAIDASASVSPTDHTYAGQFNVYDVSGTDKMTVAMNNSSDVLEANEITLESASASGNVATQEVVNNTRLLGENVVASAKVGSTRYIFFSDADDDDIYFHTTTTTTWGAEQTFRLMADAATTQLGGLSNVLGGLYLLYCENATVKGEWVVDPALSASLTVAAATASAAGEAVTLDAASLFTVAAAAAPAAGQAVALAGQGRLSVTAATAPAAGEAVTFDAASKLTVTAASAPAQGEAVDLRGAIVATFTVVPATAAAAADSALAGQGALAVTPATAPAQGESVTFDAAALFTVAAATAPAQGEAVTLHGAARLTVAAATAAAQGEAVTLTAPATLTAGTATAPAQGQAVTLYGQGRLGVTQTLASAEGENVILFGGTSVPGTLSVAPATAPAAGETVAPTAASTFAFDTATAPAQGENVTFDAAALITIIPANATAAGETVGLIGQAVLTVTPADASVVTDGAFSGAATLALSAASASATAGAVDLLGVVTLDEYIPAGHVVSIVPAGRVAHGMIAAGRTSELIPAGKP